MSWFLDCCDICELFVCCCCVVLFCWFDGGGEGGVGDLANGSNLVKSNEAFLESTFASRNISLLLKEKHYLVIVVFFGESTKFGKSTKFGELTIFGDSIAPKSRQNFITITH